MTEKLLPCPFCNGEAGFERMGDRRQSCIVACESCGCRLETGEEHGMCGRAWNTRAASQSQEREDSAELDLVASGEYVGYALVSDDNGKWAFTDGGMAPVAPKGGFAKTVGITAIADPCMWQDSPRAAIAYARRIKEEGH